jgi:enoyl-CoA hydratase/carnithine racemase
MRCSDEIRVNAIAPAAMDDAVLRSEHCDGVVVVTLNRPARRNCLSRAMIDTLAETLAAIGHERAVRAVIIAAEGPAFCAGHDLAELTAHRADPDGGAAFFEDVFGRSAALMMTIVALPQPVIACVQGTASAAGCQLVASCDLAVASADASFATPGVNIGLFCSFPMVALSRNVARKHAMEMLLTGEMVSAADALRIGLVNRVTPAGQERDEAMRLAQRIASRSAASIRLGKPAFHAQLDRSLDEAYAFAARIMAENMLIADAEEGIAAFLAKRPPHWEGQ